MSATEHRCAKRIYGGSFSGRSCQKTVKVEREGKWYCTIHDPVRVAEKAVVLRAKWNAEWKASHDARKENEDARRTLEKCAARYLWLREQVKTKATMVAAQALFWEHSSRTEFDKAVDAAMAAISEPKAPGQDEQQ